MVKTTKNTHHHKNNENTEGEKKSVKINVFRTQEIKLKACSSPECLFKKIGLILVIIARFVAL